VVNFIVMMEMCEGRKITTNMEVLLQERYRAIDYVNTERFTGVGF